jgi:iron(III) transport system permease protein
MAMVGVLLALVAVIGWPVVATILAAFEGAEGSGELLTPAPEEVSSGLRRPLGLAFETLRLVGVTEAIALPIGIALAFVLFRTDVFGRRTMLGILAVSAFVPMPLHAAAWLGAFGNAGRAQVFGLIPVLVGWSGAAFVHAMAAIPWIVLMAGVGLRTVEPELEEAALLDRPGWWVALFVTTRRALGALAASALAVAVLTAGDMTVTDILMVRTYAEEAYIQFPLKGAAVAATVALPPLVVLGGLLLIGGWGLLRLDPARLATAAARARLWRLGKWRGAVSAVTLAFLAVCVALPVYSLVWRAGRVGGNAALGRVPHWSLSGLAKTLRFAWEDSSEALFESAILGAAIASCVVVLAWSLAWLSRSSRAWRWVSAISIAVALATPGPVAGMALVFAYRDFPRVYDSIANVLMAGVLRTFPYAFLVLWPAIRSLPPEFLEAAEIDGLGPWGCIRRVALPLTWISGVAAWGVAFVLAMGELPATNLVTPPGWMPFSVLIWGLLHTGVESHLAGVVLVLLAAVSAVALPVALGLGWLGRGFR